MGGRAALGGGEAEHAGLTVIEQPVAEIGAQAMRLLVERIERPDQPVRTVVLSGSLVPRGSTGRR